MSKPQKIPPAAAANSRETRILPVFRWLTANGGPAWPSRLVQLAQGQTAVQDPGATVGKRVHLEKERRVQPSAARLKWLVEHAHLLAPQDGRRWNEYRRRVSENPLKSQFLAAINAPGLSAISGSRFRDLRLEGSTAADCLVECEHAVLWIEGKRNDWLAAGTKWDVTRDQLARNLESARLLAKQEQKDYCVILCIESELKDHEQLLVDGYRSGSWTGGVPHLDADVRAEFRSRIGIVRWWQILSAWPPLQEISELREVRTPEPAV